jgi:23S rRNA pseudouridine1911/1915/1917 synthase
MQDFEIIYDDNDLLIINKPCGVAVQSREEDIVKIFYTEKKLDLHPITRLDQAVSGLTLFAKNPSSAARLTEMINSGKINKHYTAIVEGQIAENDGRLEHNLLKTGLKMVVSDKGKLCVLTYRKMANLDRYTKLEIEIETGRFHQIRAQMSAFGHPIKGDLKYKSKRSNKEGGIYLHCHMMTIPGKNGEIMVFEAEPPKDKTLYWIN